MQKARRAVERYAMSLSAQATFFEAGGFSPVYLKTKNISSEGAFFVTDRPFRNGALLDIDLRLPFSRKKNGVEKKSSVQIRGKVIRVESGGMAVRFNGQYQFVPG